jgi:inorganic phosphate transporter, PiT family
MNMTIILFSAVIALAFVFGLTNGFIDGGGLVSTVITTRALEPLPALLLVAAGEIAGIFLFGQAVTHMLAQRLVIFPVSASALQILGVLASALLGALVWNVGMWRLALPSSSSHALVGGIVGAMCSEYGTQGISWPVLIKIVVFLGIVPIAGALLGFLFSRFTYWFGEFLTPAARKLFRVLQVLALSGISLVHGSNDGQKCLAMMLLAVLAMRQAPSASLAMPWPLMLSCGGALALGVVFGSRRIIRTVGKRLYRIEGLQGFCAETSAMLLIGASSLLGYPMSTTHVMSASVLGAGVAVHPRGVRWGLVGDIALIWLITIPAAASLAAAIVWVARSAGVRIMGGM